MDIEDIKTRIRTNQYGYSLHADIERKADELTLAQVEEALLAGTILYQKQNENVTFKNSRQVKQGGFGLDSNYEKVLLSF